MVALVSHITPDTTEFAENRKKMQTLIEDMNQRFALIKPGGHEKARQKH